MAEITVDISADADDVNQVGTDDPFTSSTLYIGWEVIYAYHIGLRFQNVTVPQGSTITAAYITVKARDADYPGALSSFASRIYLEDTDDAAAWGTGRGPAHVTKTTAYTDWNDPAAWTANSWYNSPSMVDVVQEVVDRGGWASGNDMCVCWLNNQTTTDSDLIIYDYSWSSANAAKLHIEYSESSGISIPVAMHHYRSMRG